MKTKKLILKGIVVLATTGLLFTGCRKEEEDNDTSGSSDNALAEASFEEIGSISNEAGNFGASKYRTGKPFESAYSVKGIYFYNKDTTNADTIVVDFGTSNSACIDKKQRRGKINIVYNGFYMAYGTVVTITPENYFVNDHQVIGTKQITNKGENAAGYMVFDEIVDGKIILANSAGTILWKANKTHEWGGYKTWDWTDDIHTLTGSSSGTGSNGHTFTAVITKKLIRKMSCPEHLVEGTFDFTPDNKPVRTVDFGNGTCDDLATVTVKGKVYTIHLK